MLSGTTDPGPGIGKDGDFYLNTVTWMLFGPKANGVWPAGVSVAGTGNTGTAGNTILSGSVDPTASVGNNGDYYINTTTSTLFGPKANGTWPPGVQMGGGTGSGTGGGVVLTGAGAPANSVGNNGDYYLDTNTWTLYGPKANDVWPAGVTLVTQPGGSGGTGGTGGGTAGNGGHILTAAVRRPTTSASTATSISTPRPRRCTVPRRAASGRPRARPQGQAPSTTAISTCQTRSAAAAMP